MALSELDMMNLWAKQLRGYKSQWERLFDFGYAVEAEVRKQDDALILQLVEALESSNVEWKQLADSSDAGLWRAEDQDYYQQSEKAITAGRAWLEGKK